MSKLVGMIGTILLLSCALEVRASSVDDAAAAPARGDDPTLPMHRRTL